MAEIVLPRAIGQDGRDKAVAGFVAWVRNYREGADTGHGYGSSTLSRPTGASPAARYPAQFAALDAAARTQNGTSFAALPLDRRRTVIEAALNLPQPVTRLPPRPTGANLIADFMGLYFNSADAHDLCYNAEIGRDTCRSLEGSDQAPVGRGRSPFPQIGPSGSQRSLGQATPRALAPESPDLWKRAPSPYDLRIRHRHHRRRHHGGAASRRSCPSCGPAWSIIVVEAGKRLFDLENRFEYRQRSLDYGENHVARRLHRRSGRRAASSRARWRSADRRCTGAASATGSPRRTRG